MKASSRELLENHVRRRAPKNLFTRETQLTSGTTTLLANNVDKIYKRSGVCITKKKSKNQIMSPILMLRACQSNMRYLS